MEGSRLLGVVIGDLHLGKTWNANSIPATRPMLKQAYYQPLQEAVELYGPKLISAGDFFDKTHNDEATLLSAMEYLPNFLAVVAGNHDVANRADALSSLQLISMLEGYDQIALAPSEGFAEPYYESRELCPEVGLFMVPHAPSQEVFERSLAQAAEKAKSGRWPMNVLVTHCNYGSNAGKADSELYLTPALQADMETAFDWVFLGHEHLPAKIGRTIITGSCQPCSFGEIGPRFFWELHLDAEANKLRVKQTVIERSLSFSIWHCRDDGEMTLKEGEKVAQMVTLQGRISIDSAKEVQALVRSLYANGALAVRVGELEFDSRAAAGRDQVGGSMLNLVDVVKAEISGNAVWSALLDEVLEKSKGIGST